VSSWAINEGAFVFIAGQPLTHPGGVDVVSFGSILNIAVVVSAIFSTFALPFADAEPAVLTIAVPAISATAVKIRTTVFLIR